MARTGHSKFIMVIGEWIRKGSEDFPKQNTIAILDGVRAFACLLVIWYHIYQTLILIVLLFQKQYLQPQHWNELALFFTFLMDSSYATFKQLNPPFWTLAIEWQYYMLLPLLALGIRLVAWRVKQAYRLPTTV